jgi:hypothetical protein
MIDHLAGSILVQLKLLILISIKAAKIYTANDCSSILKYIETRSALEIKNEAPHVVNRMIREYSGILVML